jgi:transglutaminase-like putative cysteine protease
MIEGPRHPLCSLALGALVTGCAGLAWQRVFAIGALLPVVAVAALTPTALVCLWSLAGRRGRGARTPALWLAVPAGAAAWLLTASVTLMRAGPALAAPARAVTGVRDCWYDLLVAAPPAPAEPALMVGVHALVWLAGYATAEIVVRTRSILPALGPALVVLIAGVGFGVGGSAPALPMVAAFIALALTLVLVRHAAGPGWRGLAFALGRGVPWIAGLAALAGLIGPAALAGRDRHPFDPRHLVHPVALPRTTVNPLDRVSAWLGAPDVTLFTVAANAPQNWRVAVLDRFDGRTWQTAAGFRVTHSRVPAGGVGPSQPLHQVVTVDALAGSWLPAAATAVQVSGIPVLADPDTGVLLSRTPLQRGMRYQVTSQVPRLDPGAVREAGPDPGAQRALALPDGAPAVLRATADTATSGASSPFEQASRLEKYLSATAQNDPSAPPGHTYGHLAYFLTVSHRGTSEQFATVFAVMARSLGLPSRVVVGFRPGTQIRPGLWQVRGADALVWPEVAFAGVGWVPFFPTPSSTSAKGETSLAEGQSQQRQELDRAVAAAPAPPAGPPAAPNAGAARPGPARPDGWRWWLTASVAGAVAGAGYLAVVLLGPAVRRHRRRRLADPAARIAAAWREALCRLRWVGDANTAAKTTQEVSVWAAERLGPPALAHLTPLSRLADEAAFSGRALPGTSGDEAWAHHDQLVVVIQGRVGHLGVVRRRLSPRILRG